MGDVLAGMHSSWEFDTDSVLIRFERGIRTPKLFHVLGERRIPYEALSSVQLGPGTRRGTMALRAVPRPGADPLLDAACGQLREATDPYRLVLPDERASQADYYATELQTLLGPQADHPAERHLVTAPQAPLQFKAYDGKVSFDGETVSFRWSWTGAPSTKWKAGDQSFTAGELAEIEWRSPENGEGHLRLRRRGPDGLPEPSPVDDPGEDPASVVFGRGYGMVHESLPLAAAVLEAVHAAGPAVPGDGCGERFDPADIAARIRHLGELHTAGLLTDEEFTSKKSELLALL
ncbi:DUF4429 domain-containing protein [Streptomyces sodiiphilus]